MFDETHVSDLLPAYALGSLDADESRQVEQHLAGCLICRAESQTFQAVAEGLSLTAPASAPSLALRERLMQRVQATRLSQPVPVQVSRRSWLERLLPVWGLASLCLIIALGAFTLSLWQRLNQLEFLTAPGGMRAIPLQATDQAPGATGFILVGVAGRNGAVVVDGLPPLGEGQQYQVWLIRNGERTSGAVFSTDEESYGGTRIQVADSLLEYTNVGITIEPAGGSPQPTGVRVLGGPLFNP